MLEDFAPDGANAVQSPAALHPPFVEQTARRVSMGTNKALTSVASTGEEDENELSGHALPPPRPSANNSDVGGQRRDTSGRIVIPLACVRHSGGLCKRGRQRLSGSIEHKAGDNN